METLNQAVEKTFTNDLVMPEQGTHVLSLRLKDENGTWGQTYSKPY